MGGLEKEFASYLTNLLRSSLGEIDATLRVKNLFSALACAFDKGFSLSSNYPKVFGELFIEWMMDNHPGCVMYHVEQVQGSIQDIIFEASLAIYINRDLNIEFFDESLRIPGKRRDNILMRNIFLLLASPEMAAQSRFLCIFYFANMHSHVLVSKEDTLAQGLSCWGSSRRAMVHAVDGESPGQSP